MTLGGALVGAVTAQAADGYFVGQRAEKRSVRAVLVPYEPQAVSVARTSSRIRAKVRRTDTEDSTRTGTTLVAAGHTAGSSVVVWTDSHGDLTSRPPTAAQAVTRAGVIGSGAALAFAGLTFGAGAVARWWLDRRCIERWGREWELVGPR